MKIAKTETKLNQLVQSTNEIMAKIAKAWNVEIINFDINNAYRITKISKINIIEFTTLKRKMEFMNKFTAYNRRLLWCAKTKARECDWKFVWIRSGSICVRKNIVLIKNNADIELKRH